MDSRGAAVSGAGSNEGDEQQRQIEDASSQLEELAGLYAAREITVAERLTARKPIEARLSVARADLARQNGTAAISGFLAEGDSLRELWVDLPLSRQRGILAALLAHAVVGAARRGYNRFDPSRVTPVWTV